jgi:flagellar basal-body rod modification protein FlgD
MAIDTNNTVSSAFNSYGTDGQNIGEDKSVLGKDDFLKLLLVELQNQDPTNPQDTDKILQQTSDLATLEASQNTNDSLANLSTAMNNSAQFSTISSIGKMADTGGTGINLENGQPVNFEIYFPENTTGGEIRISNSQGIVVESLDMGALSKGTNQFYWDGMDSSGNPYEDGTYTIEAVYTNTSGNSNIAKFGVYPIESVRFNGDETEFKLGSSYIPLSSISEIYNPDEV